jgi:hypothetical protein
MTEIYCPKCNGLDHTVVQINCYDCNRCGLRFSAPTNRVLFSIYHREHGEMEWIESIDGKINVTKDQYSALRLTGGDWEELLRDVAQEFTATPWRTVTALADDVIAGEMEARGRKRR